MSLPTCPSCGQSVLEDNVVDCPFCGAAMDGSRGAKNTPRPKAGPVVNRPGARKYPDKPADPADPSAPAPVSKMPEPPKPAPRPAAGGRGGKPVVDEDDPFGVGSAAAAASAIQATSKPEKGRLHKVVCPMCEHVGFVPKSAVGKSVRCANEKCMVPVFTATDPTDNGAERKPVRLSDTAEIARKAADSAQPKKRNPMLVYGIVGGILLLLTAAVLPLLTKAPDTTGLDKPVAIDFSKFADEEEEARLAQEAAEKARAALDAVNPVNEAAAQTRRMISMARQPNLRDKAWARRMTGDLYLRQSDLTLAAQEFNQLLVVDRARGFYRIDPHLARHWRALAAGDTTTASKELAEVMAEASGLPRTGRMGIDAALGLSAALVNDGKMDQAQQLIAARQLDTTIPDNRDAIASTAWAFVAFRCRDTEVPAPAVSDALLWINPLHCAVSLDLAIHDRWTESIAWAKTAPDARSLTDALVAITEIAAIRKAAADVLNQIEAAVADKDPVSRLRVQGAVAAAAKNVAKLDACVAAMSSLAAPTPVPLPSSTQLVQDDIQDRLTFLYQAIAVAEVVRAAVANGKNEQAELALARMQQDMLAVAPPTALVRTPVNQIASNEAAFRRQLGTELRITDETQLASMYRNYRRHLEQLDRAAEDRRLVQILLLGRIVRVGGVGVIQKAIASSAELKQDLFLDEIVGLLAISAFQSGQQFQEAAVPDKALQKGRALFGNATLVVPIAAAASQAWVQRAENLAAGLKALESGAGTDLPGIRQALACELVESAAKSTDDPVKVLTAISQLQNGVWREESYIISGRIFAQRNLDKKADSWMPAAKIPAMEQISLLYGISLGILERPIPTVPAPAATSAKGSASGSGA